MLQEITSILRKAALIMQNESPSSVFQKEGHANFVTQADQQTQDFLEEQLTTLLPGSAVIAEEKENQALTDQETWVVDPIDGTTNYIRGLDHSAISVALMVKKQLRYGVVFNPFRDEMFTAESGKGAWLNGRQIHCSDTPLERALVSFGTSPYWPSFSKPTFLAAEALMQKAADVRRFGSAALDLANIACGRTDIFFELSLQPWDYLAGWLIVMEAGGHIELIDRLDFMLDSTKAQAIFASNQTCAQPALQIILDACAEAGPKQ